ncbi:MAG TPA: hypothetical protein VD908_07295, partial [Cytophagales bacterium]|nr:hypothetical protein [Cytophagales bacterium]
MIKFIARFLLALFVLLSSGYGQMYAHHPENPSYSPTKNITAPENTIFEQTQNTEDVIIKSFGSGDENNLKIGVAESVAEEDEFLFSKKYLESHHFTPLFSGQTDPYYFHYLKKRLSFFKHFSNFSSHWSL